MTEQIEYTYDVFLSYSPEDESWVNKVLLPALTDAKLKVCKPEDFALGRPRVINVEQAIAQSRKILLVLTPRWLHSSWNQLEELLVQSSDPASLRARLVPLLVEPCELPARIKMLTPSNFTQQATHEREMNRLLRALKARVFISYKRHAKPDAALAKRIYTEIQQAGYDVFIDQTITVGQEWARMIEQQIESSDFMIVLLSEASVQSEMLAREVELAYTQYQGIGRPRLLPIRINYDEPLPYQLRLYLDKIQYAAWRSRTKDSTRHMLTQLFNAIGFGNDLPSAQITESHTIRQDPIRVPPVPYADPLFVDMLDEPSGAIRLQSTVYIERGADRVLRRELSKPHGSTTTIRAARQTGKSSLLIRGVEYAREQRHKAVFIDLQAVDNEFLQSPEAFLHHFARIIFTELELDGDVVEQRWKKLGGASDKLTDLMEDYVLPRVEGKVVLAIDEADRVLNASFHPSYFALLRSWQSKRALSDKQWGKLYIILAISTEPHLIIPNLNQSPFNVGIRIELEDFSEAQVQELNMRYRSPLSQRERLELVELLGGHPYLTNKALYTLVTERLTWDQLARIASTERSPFGDHLHHIFWILRDQPHFTDSLRQVMDHNRCSDSGAYYQLSKAGLIKGLDDGSCVFRCKLYEGYLKNKL
jgi:hypothetical protein